jgi:hypothetical protein
VCCYRHRALLLLLRQLRSVLLYLKITDVQTSYVVATTSNVSVVTVVVAGPTYTDVEVAAVTVSGGTVVETGFRIQARGSDVDGQYAFYVYEGRDFGAILFSTSISDASYFAFGESNTLYALDYPGYVVTKYPGGNPDVYLGDATTLASFNSPPAACHINNGIVSCNWNGDGYDENVFSFCDGNVLELRGDVDPDQGCAQVTLVAI